MGWHWHIFAAAVLDWLMGDPAGWPHPVRWIGLLAERLEGFCRRLFPRPRDAGIAAALATYAAAVVAACLFLEMAGLASARLRDLAAVVVIYYSLAARDLVDHVLAVHSELSRGDLPAARLAVSRLVGRDTVDLDGEGVGRAAVESLAESFCDGVAAPLFWALLLGPAGAFAYRAVNTLDSMFGHRDERYSEFGWLAARTDDLANYVPARLAALCLCCAGWPRGGFGRAWAAWRKFGGRHDSPNAGQTEAAMAGLLGTRLGGPASYDGRPARREWIDGGGRRLVPGLIVEAVSHMATAYVFALGAGVFLSPALAWLTAGGHVR